METMNNTTVEDSVELNTVNMDDSNVVVSNEDTMGVAKAINMDDFNVDKTMDSMLYMVHEKLESSNASTGEYEAMIPVSLVMKVKERLSNTVYGYIIDEGTSGDPFSEGNTVGVVTKNVVNIHDNSDSENVETVFNETETYAYGTRTFTIKNRSNTKGSQGNLHERVVKLRHKLDEVQLALDKNSLSITLCEEEAISVKSRADRSRIDCMFGQDGSMYEGNMVSRAFVEHYTEFLEGESVIYTENRESIFYIGNDKAPGPNGFSLVFSKKAWDALGSDVCKAVKDFFANGQFKIITNRMKDGLDDVVSINQSAFIPGQSISDNILLTQELMHNYHLNRGPLRCAFKIDFQKAYDTVSWNFLKEILVCFGFPSTMIKWVMACVTSMSFSIGLNGNLHGYFKGKRGLRQGDPMSLYLFTLVMEILSLMLKRRVCEDDEFAYRKKCSKQKFIDICFEDDLILFAHGDVHSASIVTEALNEFKDASALVPSIPKSTIFFSNVLDHVKASILHLMPFEEGSFPIKVVAQPRFTRQERVSDIVSNGSWTWPVAWYDMFPVLNLINVPILNHDQEDKLMWRSHDGVVMLSGLDYNNKELPYDRVMTTLFAYLKNKHPNDASLMIEVDEVTPMCSPFTMESLKL
ncbi:putative RNA-directed DNA polymerase [Tanacetum coccineum]